VPLDVSSVELVGRRVPPSLLATVALLLPVTDEVPLVALSVSD
jgi:hypothetical protein